MASEGSDQNESARAAATSPTPPPRRRAPNGPPLDPDRFSYELARYGVHHYSSGRNAARSHLFTAGNEIHHAIEYLLKAVLVRRCGATESDLRRYSHRLPDMWTAVRDDDLGIYDQTIADLDPFEELRYPETALRTGLTWNVGWGASTAQQQPAGVLPHYRCDLLQIDGLVPALIERCPWNHVTLLPMGAGGQAILVDNAHAARWQP